MEKDLVKRLVTKDGKHRISIYRDDFADNPREMTDEPLHCEDWCRDYSIMNKKERETQSSSARDFIIYMLSRYGKYEKIIDFLVENGKHMTDGKCIGNNALVYDRSKSRWVLKENGKHYVYESRANEYGWFDAEYFCGNKYTIDLVELLDVCYDSTIDELCDKKYWTDGIKMMSYQFGYYGDVHFNDYFDTESRGFAWLEKDEFLEYSGYDDNEKNVWKDKSLKEIEWLLDEIEAWSNNEVYGFVVERAVRTITNVRYPDGEHDDTETESVEWEEEDSCFGFYGELDKSLDWIISDAGFKKEELEV